MDVVKQILEVIALVLGDLALLVYLIRRSI